MKKIGFETLWGGIFGIVAILAAIIEMYVNGLNSLAIIGAIKDIAGIMIVVMVFLVAVKQLRLKKIIGFDATFEIEMIKVMKKYDPIIKKDDVCRYNIASNLDSIFNKEPGAYYLFFEIKDKGAIQFSVSKTVFMGRTKESFDDLQSIITSQISAKLERNYDLISKCETNTNGIKINFDHVLESDEDAVALAEIIDCVVLLYIAEYKK